MCCVTFQMRASRSPSDLGTLFRENRFVWTCPAAWIKPLVEKTFDTILDQSLAACLTSQSPWASRLGRAYHRRTTACRRQRAAAANTERDEEAAAGQHARETVQQERQQRAAKATEEATKLRDQRASAADRLRQLQKGTAALERQQSDRQAEIEQA